MAPPLAGITTNSTPVTTETLISGLAITIPDVGGTNLWKITFEGRVNSTAANDMARVRIRNSNDGTGTEWERGQRTVPLSGGSGQQTLNFFALVEITGSTHACATIERAVGTGSVSVACDSFSPAWLVAENLGPIT